MIIFIEVNLGEFPSLVHTQCCDVRMRENIKRVHLIGSLIIIFKLKTSFIVSPNAKRLYITAHHDEINFDRFNLLIQFLRVAVKNWFSSIINDVWICYLWMILPGRHPLQGASPNDWHLATREESLINQLKFYQTLRYYLV